MKVSKEDKQRLKYLLPIGILAGILIAGIVIKNTDIGERKVSDVEVSSGTKVVPMSKEVRESRLSLSQKIKKMDCAVVNANVPESDLKFKCKKPSEKVYTRKELLDSN